MKCCLISGLQGARLSPEYARWQGSQGMPRNGDLFLIEPDYDEETQTIELSGEVNPALPQVTWLVDDREVVSASWPYQADWQLHKGLHTLEMAGGGMRSEVVEFEVR